ncbi:hypothetical protein GCM10010347_21240 [Streptomyces cirratus]|uniref:Uncharacterized protein n=1 Tax=Streptomyces cirratus TaxID=68187 RepID=A0ABQ3EUJ1_9ACTN|nr:hypothetical protein GCM10010347_21240 [Streptomyces cirratus]
MQFAQIVGFGTEHEQEVRGLLRSHEGQARARSRENGPNSRIPLKDRENPRHFPAVVEFDPSEKAMANSNAPGTNEPAGLSDRLVPAGGQDSRGELPYRPAALLAERLGTELRHFPGGHTGLTTHPTQFGELPQKAFRP